MNLARTCLVAALLTLPLFLSTRSMAADASMGCDVRASLGFCYDYVGGDWSPQKAKTDCESASGGKLLESGCPDGPVVGVCDFNPQDKEGMKIRYSFYKDAFSLKAARMSCPGVFTAK